MALKGTDSKSKCIREMEEGTRGAKAVTCCKGGYIAQNCPDLKLETRICNRCGKTGHLAPQAGVPARDVDEEN